MPTPHRIFGRIEGVLEAGLRGGGGAGVDGEGRGRSLLRVMRASEKLLVIKAGREGIKIR